MKYILELEGGDLLLIGTGIDLLPHGKVAPLVARIQAQITAQDVAAAEKAKPAPIVKSKRVRKR